MARLIKVNYQQIEQLSAERLTELLSILLHVEAAKNLIPLSTVEVPLKINVSDEGEDGRIKWSGEPEKTNWVPNKYTIFQCKATNIQPSDCKKELLKPDGKNLKSKVQEVLENNGSYILFYGRSCNTAQQTPRLQAFREAIQQAGHSFFSNADLHIYDSNKIVSWVNEYIPAIIAVNYWTGKKLPINLQTWQMWEGYSCNQFSYVEDEKLNNYIKQIRDHFVDSKKVARIVGLSGLGKTRLALEAFRPPKVSDEDIVQQALSDGVVYVNNADLNKAYIVSAVMQLRNHNQKGLLVVDNCDIELHHELHNEVTHKDSCLSLLTLDNDPEQRCGNVPLIKLTTMTDDVIRGLLTQAYPGLSVSDLDRIVAFAQGFPQMAVLMAQARLKNEINIGVLDDDVLVKKLIWGNKPEDKDAYNVISGCALFEHVGFFDNCTEQRQFVAREICGIDDNQFFAYAQSFINRGLLDRRHRFVRVVPKPLAVRLAADWWKKCPPERAKELLMMEMPEGLAEELYAMIAMLDFLPHAQSLVEDLCGKQAPFGKVEVLNSEKGSGLFHFLVEVNPHATLNTLEDVFGSWSREQLIEVEQGRRNLVMALEKLCFWPETFDAAAKLLLKFAVAENESWGNNATNQFLQLFHIYLSGTQVPPSSRLGLIDYAISSGCHEEKVLGIKALGYALHSRNFIRMGGVECQGSKAIMEDWFPNSPIKIKNYWIECLQRLTKLAVIDNDYSEISRDQITTNLRGLVQYGLFDEIENCIKEIIRKKDFWPEAYEAVQECIRFEGQDMVANQQEQLSGWLELLRPQSIKEKIRLIVNKPSWSNNIEVNGDIIDISVKDARDFAKECSNNLTLLIETETLEELLKGEQRQGYIFGFELATLLDVPESFLKPAMRLLSSLKPEEANPDVLAGFLSAVKLKTPDLFKKYINKVAFDDYLYIYTVELARRSRLDLEDLEIIKELLRQGKIGDFHLRLLSYGSVMSHLSPSDVKAFCTDSIAISLDLISASFHILYMYCFANPKNVSEFRDLFKHILSNPGFLSKCLSTNDVYDWHLIAKDLLETDTKDVDFANIITQEIICICTDDRVSLGVHREIAFVIEILFKIHPENTWKTISDALLSASWRLLSNLSDLLSARYVRREDFDLISLLPLDLLISFCDKNTESGPEILSKIIPTLLQTDSGYSFHPVAEFLIDNYGHRGKVLSQLFWNMGLFSWVGSPISQYEQQIEVLETIQNHPNPAVRVWGKKHVEGLKKEISYIKQEEEEESFKSSQ